MRRQGNGKKDTTLLLPLDSSYMRACAHNFAQRLGMQTETQRAGEHTAVRVDAQALLPGKANSSLGNATGGGSSCTGADAGALGSSGSKRKEPPDHDADADSS